jgi:hypothetical protein
MIKIPIGNQYTHIDLRQAVSNKLRWTSIVAVDNQLGLGSFASHRSHASRLLQNVARPSNLLQKPFFQTVSVAFATIRQRSTWKILQIRVLVRKLCDEAPGSAGGAGNESQRSFLT